MAYFPATGSIVGFQSDPTKLLTHSSVSGSLNIVGNPSISGTVNIAGNPSISGTVRVVQQTDPWKVDLDKIAGASAAVSGGTEATALRVTIASDSTGPGSVAAHIKSGSIIVLLGSTSVVAVQSTTWPGSVLAFPTGNQSVSGSVGIVGNPSISGTVLVNNGSVVAFISGTPNVNTAGSVVAFQGGAPWANNIGGSVITVQQANSIVGTYAEDAGHTTADKGLATWGVRNDAVASFVSADLDYTPIAVDSAGRNLMKPFAASESQIEGAALTYGTASVLMVAAAGAGLRNYITDILIANPGAATTLVTFTDSTASILGYTIAPTTGGSNIIGLATPIRTAANSAFNITGATITSLYGTVRGYRAP